MPFPYCVSLEKRPMATFLLMVFPSVLTATPSVPVTSTSCWAYAVQHNNANTATHIRRMFLFIRTFRWFDSWLIQLSMVPQSYKFFNADLFFLSWISNGRQADTGRPPGETCSPHAPPYQKDSTYTIFTWQIQQKHSLPLTHTFESSHNLASECKQTLTKQL